MVWPYQPGPYQPAGNTHAVKMEIPKVAFEFVPFRLFLRFVLCFLVPLLDSTLLIVTLDDSIIDRRLDEPVMSADGQF